MAVTLIRGSGDKGSVLNSDDARIMRYAVNNRDGIVRGYGKELELKFESNFCVVQNGEFIIDGWQVRVSEVGETIPFQTNATYYCKIYVEIDLRVNDEQKAAILTEYSLSQELNPTIDTGDDLTKNPNGAARRLLYYIKVTNGVGQIVKSAEILEYNYADIPYVNKQIEKVKEQVQAVKNIESDNVIIGGNVVGTIRRQVNFVHLNIEMPVNTIYSYSRLGQIFPNSEVYYIDQYYSAKINFNIPKKYCPKNLLSTAGVLYGYDGYKIDGKEIESNLTNDGGGVNVEIDTDGSASIFINLAKICVSVEAICKDFRIIINAGYEITGGAND